jgi:hypothetical protein
MANTEAALQYALTFPQGSAKRIMFIWMALQAERACATYDPLLMFKVPKPRSTGQEGARHATA